MLAYLHLCDVYACLCINTYINLYIDTNTPDIYLCICILCIICFMILVFTLEEILHCFGRMDNSKASNQTNGVPELPGGVINHKQAQGRTGVNSYFRRHELALTHSYWQVI